MLNMIIWIFSIAAILLVLYYLGYLLISIVRKSFKSSASKQSPQVVAKPPVSLEEPPEAMAHHKISIPYLIFSIIIALSFCFIIYQECQIQALSKKVQRIESNSDQLDLEYKINSLESELSHLDSRIDTCESDIDDLKNYGYEVGR